MWTALLLGAAVASVTAVDLRCENLIDPLGLDATEPRLTWRLDSAIHQAGFRVRAATSLAKLETPDLWESGIVHSKVSRIRWGGSRLASGGVVYWQVLPFGESQNGRWSEPAKFTMGLLHRADWQAEWIGEDWPRPTLGGAQWIGPEGGATGVQPGAYAFTTTVESGGVGPRGIVISADDQWTLYLNDRLVGESRPREGWKNVRAFSRVFEAGVTRVRVVVRNRGDKPSPCGLIANVAGVATGPGWELDGEPAPILGDDGMAPWGGMDRRLMPDGPAPIVEKSISIKPGLVRATLYASGAGVFVCSVNGLQVGDAVLEPGFTRWDKRVLYTTHEVASMLHPGENHLCLELGNGFLNVPTPDAWDFETAHWRSRPVGIASLHLEYADGSREVIGTDSTWTVRDGGTVWDAVRQGEWFVAGRKPGPSTPAVVRPGPGGALKAQASHPMRVTERFRPARVLEPKPGVYLLDYGVNMAGRVALQARFDAPRRITLKYGEKLNADGTLDQRNIDGLVFGGPFQQETYDAQGRARESWSSRFTYHGFQYVQVTGWPGKPRPEELVAEVVGTDMTPRASFTSSDSRLNWLWEATRRSYRSNFHSIPTDCPHREKNGWTGDAHLASGFGLLAFDSEAPYEKWLNDLSDEQQPDGSLPGIVPTPGWGYAWGNGPAWDSAIVIVPWNLYQATGDATALERHYGAMRRYVDYMVTRSPGLIAEFGLGDWVPHKAVTSVALTSTAFLWQDATIVAEAARLTGREADHRKYTQLADDVRAAWREAFAKGEQPIALQTQTGMACGLALALLPESLNDEAGRRLAEQVMEEMDVGLLGAAWLLPALERIGRYDVAFDVLTRESYPSWGWWRARGATSLWESWDGEASRNHIMFGPVTAWMVQHLGGARPLEPGYAKFELAPKPFAGLDSCEITQELPQGRLESRWKVEGGAFRWEVTIPPNASAVAILPDGGRRILGPGPHRL